TRHEILPSGHGTPAWVPRDARLGRRRHCENRSLPLPLTLLRLFGEHVADASEEHADRKPSTNPSHAAHLHSVERDVEASPTQRVLSATPRRLAGGSAVMGSSL